MFSDNLLSSCLHSQIQNTNEVLNMIFWSHCPKNVFAGTNTLEIGPNSAILHFNDGSTVVLNALNCFGFSRQVTHAKGLE